MRIAKNATSLKKVSFAFSPLSGAGLALGTVHMVAFLGIFEVLGPMMTKLYHNDFTEFKVETRQHAFTNRYQELDVTKLDLNEDEKCAEHFAGLDENQKAPLCTRVPLLAELRSYHDYSKTWRNKTILDDFHLAYSRWAKKLSSFFNNYFGAMEQVQHLSRSREVLLTGKSEYELAFAEKERQRAKETILRSAYAIPQDTGPIFDEIYAEALRQVNEPEYISPYALLEMGEPHRETFDLAKIMVYRENNLELFKTGNLYYGLNGDGHEPSPDEIEQRRTDILAFLDKAPLMMNHPIWPATHGVADYEINQVIRAAGFPNSLMGTPYAARGTRELIQHLLNSENEEDVAMGMVVFADWIPYMFGDPAPKHKAQVPNIDDETFESYLDLQAALEYFVPMFPGESIYIDSAYAKYGRLHKNPSEKQRSDKTFGLETKRLSDFTLTQLMCGDQSSAYDDVEAALEKDSGFALEFPFPKLRSDDLCAHVYYPVAMDGEDKPSPVRSLFASRSGMQYGLHQAYIHDTDSQNPLLFNTEEQATTWWNNTVQPDSLARLAANQERYKAMSERFFAKAIHGNVSNWWDGLVKYLPFSGNEAVDNARKTNGKLSTADSLAESMSNELFHYLGALQRFVPVSESAETAAAYTGLSECLLKLLNSIPDKNYTVIKTECDPHLAYVKERVITGVSNFEEASQIVEMTDEDFEKASNKADLIKSRIKIEIGLQIEALFEEVRVYNEMINENFKFNLDDEGVGQ